MIGLIVATSGDFGMALTYAFIFVIMAWAGGVKKRWFLLAIVVCVIGAVLIWPHISDKYFARRITVVIDHITGNTETISEQTQGQGLSADPQHPGYRQRGVVRHGVSQGDSDPEPL